MKRYEIIPCDKFKCIGKDCKKNCCIGWEISIDNKSLKRYLSEEFSGKEDFNKKINLKEKKFNLLSNGRCPFLDSDNLCSLIKRYGEKSLCEICKTHPRYKTFLSGRTETGLGLCCERAAELIINEERKIKPLLISGKKENLTTFQKYSIKERKKFLSIFQDKDLSVLRRIDKTCKEINFDVKKIDAVFIKDFMFNLERLDKSWEEKLKLLPKKLTVIEGFEKENENLLSYFAFRHICGAIDKTDLRARIIFIILSVYVINSIVKEKGKTKENLILISREFSSEIEYSDNNFFSFLDMIEEKFR